MVQKHEMIADFEKIVYSSDMLVQCWKGQIDNFTELANGGWTDYSIVDFIHYINGTVFNSILFPDSSLGTLLISKPMNGYLNYQQTLSITFDESIKLYTMKYSDWDTINSVEDSEKAVLWIVKCPGIELGSKFIEFLKWQKMWWHDTK